MSAWPPTPSASAADQAPQYQFDRPERQIGMRSASVTQVAPPGAREGTLHPRGSSIDHSNGGRSSSSRVLAPLAPPRASEAVLTMPRSHSTSKPLLGMPSAPFPHSGKYDRVWNLLNTEAKRRAEANEPQSAARHTPSRESVPHGAHDGLHTPPKGEDRCSPSPIPWAIPSVTTMSPSTHSSVNVNHNPLHGLVSPVASAEPIAKHPPWTAGTVTASRANGATTVYAAYMGDMGRERRLHVMGDVPSHGHDNVSLLHDSTAPRELLERSSGTPHNGAPGRRGTGAPSGKGPLPLALTKPNVYRPELPMSMKPGYAAAKYSHVRESAARREKCLRPPAKPRWVNPSVSRGIQVSVSPPSTEDDEDDANAKANVSQDRRSAVKSRAQGRSGQTAPNERRESDAHVHRPRRCEPSPDAGRSPKSGLEKGTENPTASPPRRSKRAELAPDAHRSPSPLGAQSSPGRAARRADADWLAELDSLPLREGGAAAELLAFLQKALAGAEDVNAQMVGECRQNKGKRTKQEIEDAIWAAGSDSPVGPNASRGRRRGTRTASPGGVAESFRDNVPKGDLSLDKMEEKYASLVELCRQQQLLINQLPVKETPEGARSTHPLGGCSSAPSVHSTDSSGRPADYRSASAGRGGSPQLSRESERGAPRTEGRKVGVVRHKERQLMHKEPLDAASTAPAESCRVHVPPLRLARGGEELTQRTSTPHQAKRLASSLGQSPVDGLLEPADSSIGSPRSLSRTSVVADGVSHRAEPRAEVGDCATSSHGAPPHCGNEARAQREAALWASIVPDDGNDSARSAAPKVKSGEAGNPAAAAREDLQHSPHLRDRMALLQEMQQEQLKEVARRLEEQQQAFALQQNMQLSEALRLSQQHQELMAKQLADLRSELQRERQRSSSRNSAVERQPVTEGDGVARDAPEPVVAPFGINYKGTSPAVVEPPSSQLGEVHVDARQLIDLLERKKPWEVDDCEEQQRSERDASVDEEEVSLIPKVWSRSEPSRVDRSTSFDHDTSLSAKRSSASPAALHSAVAPRSSLSQNLSRYFSCRNKPTQNRQKPQKGDAPALNAPAAFLPKQGRPTAAQLQSIQPLPRGAPGCSALASSGTGTLASASGDVPKSPLATQDTNAGSTGHDAGMPALWSLFDLVGPKRGVDDNAIPEAAPAPTGDSVADDDLIRALSLSCGTSAEAASMFYDLREAYLRTRQRYQ